MRIAISRESAQRANDAFLVAIFAARTGVPVDGLNLATRAVTSLAGKLQPDHPPRAYTGPWPITSHRTLAEVDAQQGQSA